MTFGGALGDAGRRKVLLHVRQAVLRCDFDGTFELTVRYTAMQWSGELAGVLFPGYHSDNHFFLTRELRLCVHI